jgi:hypothetical protein
MRRDVTLVVAVVFVGWASLGYAQVPTSQDIAACNTEAEHAVRRGAASQDSAQPNTKDHTRAAAARRSEPSGSTASGGTQSEDPQVAGMDADGAKDPVYQAAYRTCMRKSGF